MGNKNYEGCTKEWSLIIVEPERETEGIEEKH